MEVLTGSKQKYCKHCGERIDAQAVVCVKCGRQVEELKVSAPQPSIIINNANSNASNNTNNNTSSNSASQSKVKNKWVALFLCLFFGVLGAHKFYEGKPGMGILYIFTSGLFGIGLLIDFLVLLFKPRPRHYLV